MARKSKQHARERTPGESALRGHAGEMYVSAELMRRGWLAAMTARGSRSFDVLARRVGAPVFTAIRVKTGDSARGGFLWMAKKDGTLFLDLSDTRDFTVIVDLPLTGDPLFYVLPTTILDQHLRASHAEWLQKPGVRGQQHSPDTKARALWFDERINQTGHGYFVKFAKYRDAWDLLGERG
jgi:hypothetical protein